MEAADVQFGVFCFLLTDCILAGLICAQTATMEDLFSINK